VGRFDDAHLRAFIAARDRGDAAEMRRHWDELVIDFADRMDGFVGAAHKGRLDDDEHEEAVQLAMIKFSQNLLHTFSGISMGQLVNACRRLAAYVCIDVQRAAARNAEVSADAAWESADDERTQQGWEVDEAMKHFEAEERAADLREFFLTAFPKLIDSRREVVELTFFSSLDDAQIAERTETKPNNVQQRRRRGLQDLRKLYNEHWDQ